jgi:hypothetical protein
MPSECPNGLEVRDFRMGTSFTVSFIALVVRENTTYNTT